MTDRDRIRKLLVEHIDERLEYIYKQAFDLVQIEISDDLQKVKVHIPKPTWSVGNIQEINVETLEERYGHKIQEEQSD